MEARSRYIRTGGPVLISETVRHVLFDPKTPLSNELRRKA